MSTLSRQGSRKRRPGKAKARGPFFNFAPILSRWVTTFDREGDRISLKYCDYIFDATMALGVAKRMEPDAGVVLVWCLCIVLGGSKLRAFGAFI
jgi:hypothetical protein